MKVRFFDIDWELDWDDEGEEENRDMELERSRPPTPVEVGIPTEVVLEVADDLDMREEGADILSDKFGFLVRGFQFNAEGKCPLCGAALDYQGGEVQDVTYVYDVTCTSCDWAGHENYDMRFTSQDP